MNRMTDGITNYGALPGSIYDQPPEESEAVFVPHEFAGSFSTDSKYPTSRDSSSPNSGAHDSAATPTMSESLAQRKRDMVARCTEEAKRAGKKLLFGMTTSLACNPYRFPPIATSTRPSCTLYPALRASGFVHAMHHCKRIFGNMRLKPPMWK